MAVGSNPGRFATAIKLATTQTMVITNQGFGGGSPNDSARRRWARPPSSTMTGGRTRNLAYRMLIMNYEINPTEQGKQLLDEFMRARSKPPGSLLFEMPKK